MSWFPLLQIRDRRHARLIHLRCAAIAILVLAVMPPRAEAVEQTLLLELAVNGRSTGKIAEYTLRDGVLLARRSELRDLGFRIPDSLTSVSDGLIALSNLAGLTWLVDYPTQTLQVTAANDSLLPALLEVTGRSDGGGAVESGKGVTFGYDITGSSTDHQSVVSGLLDLRAFSPWGVASSGMLAYAGNGPGTSSTNSTIRLDTTYTMSDPATLRRYRIGDFINGGLSWTRPVRLGGVQVTSDFTMRPDLVTFPLPSISASVAVPSTQSSPRKSSAPGQCTVMKINSMVTHVRVPGLFRLMVWASQ
jgi:outer membrane usher protein